MRNIRIVSPEPDRYGKTRSLGTKVFVGDEGSPQVWQELNNVISIDVHIRTNELVTADITLYLNPEKRYAESEFYALDPVTGNKRRLKEIQWADGGAFIC